jgi:ATP-dependent RNA helicase RhlE
MLNFQKLNLNPLIIKSLEKKGYTTPTPIQEQSIPHLLEGKDLLGIAQTGTGKTAAFSLPLLDKLSKETKTNNHQIKALILSPTRELAVQIADNIKLYGEGLKLKHAVIFGGVNEFHQIKALKSGIDIVIATPGRLLDLTNQGYVDYSHIEFFVLDEADRMLDLGFINDVKKIISKLPKNRQSLLFSATMPESISQLAHSILKDPITVEITPQSTTVERINQKIYQVDKSNKSALLLEVITAKDVVASLVFCKTKHGANKIVEYLKKYGVSVSAIHGNKSQPAREKALNDLRSGKVKILVATDIAARGIDIPSISHVINYDIPHDPENYVHRIGRTARAGREGIAISFCDYSENLHLRAIEKIIGTKIPVDKNHPFHGAVASSNPNEGRILSRNNNNKNLDNSKQNNFSKPRKISDGSRSSHDNKKTSNNNSGNNFKKFTKSFEDKKFNNKKSFNQDSSNQSRFSKNGSEKKESTTQKILKKFGFANFKNKLIPDNFGNSDKYSAKNSSKYSKRGEVLITKGENSRNENFNYRNSKANSNGYSMGNSNNTSGGNRFNKKPFGKNNNFKSGGKFFKK